VEYKPVSDGCGAPSISRVVRSNRPVRCESDVVFGTLIDVPLLVAVFLAMLVFRRQLVGALAGTGLPPMGTYLLLSVPLIVFEEQIDCQAAWCGRALIPPTLPFLFVEILALGVIVLAVKAKSVLRVTLFFCVYGVLFELLLGGLRGAPPLVVAVLGPYVALGYAFISMLPLTALMEGRRVRAPRGAAA